MINKKIMFCAAFVLILVNITLVDATFQYYGNGLKKDYKIGESISGYVNLSLNNEFADSFLRTSFGDSIKIIDLLRINGFEENRDFNCSNPGCDKEYLPKNPIDSVDINGDKILGLKIEGSDIREITLAKFNVESSIHEVCGPPLFLDVIDDGENVISGKEYGDVACSSKQYGCFDNGLNSYSNVIIEDFQICETISVDSAPAYRIGARIIKNTQGNGKLEMTALDMDGNSFSCLLPEQTVAEEELDCIVELSSLRKTNLTICIENIEYAGAGSSNYKIRSESKSPVCGTSNKDLEIYATALEYNVTKIEVNNDIFENLYSLSLENYIYDYLLDKYRTNQDGGVICSPCIVPINISGQPQNLKFSNIEFLYRDGVFTTDDIAYKKIYDVEEIGSSITSKPLKISLGAANLKIKDENASVLILYIGENVLLEKNISVEKSFDFELRPKFTVVGLEADFEVITDFKINQTKWNFGDGTSFNSSSKNSSHAYLNNGNFNLSVEAIRGDGIRALKIFDILVGNPKESANKTIEKYMGRLSNITTQIKSSESWLQNKLFELSKFDELNRSVYILETKFKNSSTDNEYSEIVRNLLDLKVPYLIGPSKQGTLPINVGFSNIDERYIEELSGETVSDSAELKKAIISWFDYNYRVNVKFVQVSSFLDDDSNDLLSKFSFDVNPIAEEEAYLFIDYPFENIIFKEDYGQKHAREGAGTYVFLDGKKKIVEFYVLGNVELSDLGSYISPEISRFGLAEEKPTCIPGDKSCELPFQWGRFGIWLGSLGAVFLVIYIIIQEWYKKNYERYLFKNHHDLYNLINFIYNSRIAGLTDQDIRRKLKGPGWGGEQITYALRKISGKRTGMWEIPILKMFENNKIRREIEMRQRKPIDTRFIKRPRF